jgi:hypothetical protein
MPRKPFASETRYLCLGPVDPETGAFRHPSVKTPQGHRNRHVFLQLMFDELLADYLLHNRKKLPSTTSVQELMAWSAAQTNAAWRYVVDRPAEKMSHSRSPEEIREHQAKFE